jgi:hypothetical protein
MFHKVNNIVYINGEEFLIKDLEDVLGKYDKAGHNVHYYDGRKHYVSDGKTQVACPVPYAYFEQAKARVPEIRMCRQQRLIDEKHLETLRNGRR